MKPKPPLERRVTGVVLGPRGSVIHHAPRGPGVPPVGATMPWRMKEPRIGKRPNHP